MSDVAAFVHWFYGIWWFRSELYRQFCLFLTLDFWLCTEVVVGGVLMINWFLCKPPSYLFHTVCYFEPPVIWISPNSSEPHFPKPFVIILTWDPFRGINRTRINFKGRKWEFWVSSAHWITARNHQAILKSAYPSGIEPHKVYSSYFIYHFVLH